MKKMKVILSIILLCSLETSIFSQNVKDKIIGIGIDVTPYSLGMMASSNITHDMGVQVIVNPLLDLKTYNIRVSYNYTGYVTDAIPYAFIMTGVWSTPKDKWSNGVEGVNKNIWGFSDGNDIMYGAGIGGGINFYLKNFNKNFLPISIILEVEYRVNLNNANCPSGLNGRFGIIYHF
jgi:hypothetical protein